MLDDATASAQVPSAKDLSARLLDAQVEWAVGEFRGKRLHAMISRDVTDLLDVAAGLTVAQLADVAAVKQAAHRLVDVIGGSEVVADLIPTFADAIYGLATADEHLLGDVVGRASVDALFAKLLGMHQLHDRAMQRLAESPLVATIATSYVTKIVGDFVQQNRVRAEKLPGVSSLFSIGLGAASKVRGATDQLLGDAPARGAQFAARRTNGAMREILREAPVQAAAMQVWDMHAEKPISELREYLTAQDLRDLLAIVHDIVTTARNLDYSSAALDACIDVFFERFGASDVTSLLAELGLTRDVLIDEIRELAPAAIEAAVTDGRLTTLIRDRLAPFFDSPAALAILRGEQAPTRPRPATRKTARKTVGKSAAAG